MGSSDTSVASSVASPGPLDTRLPSVTMARPTRPPMGAMTRVNSRFSSADRSAASTADTCASASAADDARRSCSSADIAFSAESRRARSRSAAVRANAALARARSARNRSTSAWNGRGSIWKSRSPRRTTAPSVKCTDAIRPDTRGRTSTWCTASRRPVNSLHSVTSRATAFAAVTGGAGGGAPWAAGDAQAARVKEVAVRRDSAANEANRDVIDMPASWRADPPSHNSAEDRGEDRSGGPRFAGAFRPGGHRPLV